MTSIVAGVRNTSSAGTDERPKDFKEMIMWRSPNGTAPLFALMSKLKSEAPKDPEFNWWGEPNDIIRLQLNGVMNTTTTTTFVIDSQDPDATNPERPWGTAENLVAGQLILVEKADAATYDNEIIMVSSVTNSTTFVAKRGQCGTTAAAIADDAYLTVIGNAHGEGTDKASFGTRNPSKYTNYCQIFKTGYGISKSQAKVQNMRTGDALKNDKKRKMFDHARDMEMAYLWGVKHEGTDADGNPLRFTGGLRQWVNSNNVTVFATTVTTTSFLDATYQLFDYDTGAGDERIAFCGNQALNTINQIVAGSGQIQFGKVVDLYGMRLQEYVLPQGKLYLKSHPLMNRHGRYKASMFIVDPTSLVDRPFRKTVFSDNIQTPGADRIEGEWLTESGLMVLYGGLTNGYLGNLTNP